MNSDHVLGFVVGVVYSVGVVFAVSLAHAAGRDAPAPRTTTERDDDDVIPLHEYAERNHHQRGA